VKRDKIDLGKRSDKHRYDDKIKLDKVKVVHEVY